MPSQKIDPTARISPDALIADGVEIGPYTTIEARVEIGKDTKIGPYCLIQGPTTIGSGCTITGYASIGTPPQDHSYKGEDTKLVIGNGNTIREFVTINRGTLKDKGITTIGSGNLIMAYCHVAHDCVVGDHVVMGNLATLAGHVEIHDRAIIGGLSAVHQFTRIGACSIVGGGSMVSLDIIPYAKASGDRAGLFGVNTIGLKRGGFSPEQIKGIEKAYRILLKQGLLLKEAIQAIEEEFPGRPEIELLLNFLKSTRRGIAR
ncbi:MAG TPA: acyl-ACP--UDP-N-acetylglucosamine O-acyltransferase [Deltaproteobacteria bacterium]|jgi:UDP-N-acetylglucosamine acyltransferase|nr:acyl-ACP--UDP-N-acetylglucosamine O-acyltransferase [Deltaproteobacteria bacterium]HQJ09691.1 acyl-ACP--UDP-N-acetylglucosamine O-acyltransferase [Deltaproteobacteria bacterium]